METEDYSGGHSPAPQSPRLLGAEWTLRPPRPSRWQKDLCPPHGECEGRAVWVPPRAHGAQAACPCADGRWPAPRPWWLSRSRPGEWSGAAWSHRVGAWFPPPGRRSQAPPWPGARPPSPREPLPWPGRRWRPWGYLHQWALEPWARLSGAPRPSTWTGSAATRWYPAEHLEAQKQLVGAGKAQDIRPAKLLQGGRAAPRLPGRQSKPFPEKRFPQGRNSALENGRGKLPFSAARAWGQRGVSRHDTPGPLGRKIFCSHRSLLPGWRHSQEPDCLVPCTHTSLAPSLFTCPLPRKAYHTPTKNRGLCPTSSSQALTSATFPTDGLNPLPKSCSRAPPLGGFPGHLPLKDFTPPEKGEIGEDKGTFMEDLHPTRLCVTLQPPIIL